ncbi:MAG: diacylglycerol kinase family lipid kinase [Sandaracinaceae bacterium]|nr:diacylglycerol kinase family lipid kinase [Sandaracinaceae bacterium]
MTDAADRWLAVVNPAAGGGRCGKRAASALARLTGGGMPIDVFTTTRAGEGTERVRQEAAQGRRRFLAVGGDGTSYEIVNGLFPRDAGAPTPTLAMLPLGTGNSFLRDFAITDADAALRAILAGETHLCDVVRAEHAGGAIHYINILSLGFSADVGALTNRRFKRLGAAGYVVSVFITAARLAQPSFPIRVDGGATDARACVLLSFSNSRFTGGTMMMAPHADPTDGALDVIRISAMPRLPFVRSFPSIFAGKHVEHPKVEETRARTVELDLTGPVDVMVDGEVLALALTRLEVLPGALEVVA